MASFVTHPEMEVLAIIREGCWDKWQKAKSKVKPSDYCKQELGMREIKSKNFLECYWDAGSLREAAIEYRRLSKVPKGELCLADLIR